MPGNWLKKGGVQVAVVAVEEKRLEKLSGCDIQKAIDGLTALGMPAEQEHGGLIVEITPNRPDLFSMEGIARALKSYYGGKITKYEAKKGQYVVGVDKKTESVRPFVRCSVVKGVDLDGELIVDLMQMQEKLHDTIGRKRRKVAVGIHDMGKVVFPLKYVVATDERFVPLDVSGEMSVLEVLEKHPKGREYAHLVKEGAVVIVDGEGAISFPPIINSERTRVMEKTRDLLVDVTGTHKESVEGVLNIVTTTLMDAGGEAFTVEVDGKEYPNFSYKEMELGLERANKVLGTDLSKKEAATCLKKMGYLCDGNMVGVPPYRTDVISFVDVAEDIAIGYGYDNIRAELPLVGGIGKTERQAYLHQIMGGMGFVEVKNFILTEGKSLKELGRGGGMLKITNSKSEEYNVVRTCLLPGVFVDFATNKTKGLPQKFYEIGTVWCGSEEEHLCAANTGIRATFTEMQGCLQTLMNEVGVSFELEEKKDPMFVEGRCFSIKSDKYELGVVGEITPEVIGVFGLEYPVAAFEINLKRIR